MLVYSLGFFLEQLQRVHDFNVESHESVSNSEDRAWRLFWAASDLLGHCAPRGAGVLDWLSMGCSGKLQGLDW